MTAVFGRARAQGACFGIGGDRKPARALGGLYLISAEGPYAFVMALCNSSLIECWPFLDAV